MVEKKVKVCLEGNHNTASGFSVVAVQSNPHHSVICSSTWIFHFIEPFKYDSPSSGGLTLAHCK